MSISNLIHQKRNQRFQNEEDEDGEQVDPAYKIEFDDGLKPSLFIDLQK